MYKIFDDCVPSRVNADLCVHFVLSNHKYDRPIARVCKHDGDGDVVTTDEKLWDHVECDDFICFKPKVETTPIYANRSIIKTNIYNKTEIPNEIKNWYWADCRAAYVRDADTLEEIEILYNNETYDQQEGRDKLDDGLPKIIDDMKNNTELVIAMNGSCDTYIRRVTDDVYMVVTADAVAS